MSCTELRTAFEEADAALQTSIANRNTARQTESQTYTDLAEAKQAVNAADVTYNEARGAVILADISVNDAGIASNQAYQTYLQCVIDNPESSEAEAGEARVQLLRVLSDRVIKAA